MAIDWEEFTERTPVPQHSIAGRTSRPIDTRASAGAARGSAGAALVTFASNQANEFTLNDRIRRELNQSTARAGQFFSHAAPNDSRKLLAEVQVMVRRHGTMTGRMFLGLTLHQLTNDPAHTIQRIRNTPRIGIGVAEGDQRESRWFLGTQV